MHRVLVNAFDNNHHIFMYTSFVVVVVTAQQLISYHQLARPRKSTTMAGLSHRKRFSLSLHSLIDDILMPFYFKDSILDYSICHFNL